MVTETILSNLYHQDPCGNLKKRVSSDAPIPRSYKAPMTDGSTELKQKVVPAGLDMRLGAGLCRAGFLRSDCPDRCDREGARGIDDKFYQRTGPDEVTVVFRIAVERSQACNLLCAIDGCARKC